LKNYYDMLSVARDAPADEIKKAFRREIARYHPDKVQHLGQEFQEMAAGIAADLTEAYRILMDSELRARYDEELSEGGAARAPAAARSPAAPRPEAAAPPPPAPPPPSEPGAQGRRPAAAGIDFVRKASLSRLRDAIGVVLSGAEPFAAPGFDIAVASNPKRGLFKKAEDKVRLLAKFVTQVDAEAVASVWPGAAKAQAADTTLCVLLVGPGMASAQDLASAVSEQRRKGRTTGGPVLVPVDVRDWDALFPPETPAPVRSVIQRLKDEPH
jgi:curved DNA-binding protein CbpA